MYVEKNAYNPKKFDIRQLTQDDINGIISAIQNVKLRNRSVDQERVLRMLEILGYRKLYKGQCT